MLRDLFTRLDGIIDNSITGLAAWFTHTFPGLVWLYQFVMSIQWAQVAPVAIIFFAYGFVTGITRSGWAASGR